MNSAPYLHPVGYARVGHDLGPLDYVMVVPVSTYTCEGLYLIDMGFGKPALYCAGSNHNMKRPMIRLWWRDPNDFQEVTRAQFEHMVIGQVAMKAIMMCPHLLENIDLAYGGAQKSPMLEMLPLISAPPDAPSAAA